MRKLNYQSANIMPIYIMRTNIYRRSGEYGGGSDESLSAAESRDLLHGRLQPRERAINCLLPKGLLPQNVIMSMNVVIPVLSDEIAQIWRDAGITGWHGTKVKLFDEQDGSAIGSGVAVSINGRCQFDNGRSEKDNLADCGHPDLFLKQPVNTALIYATQKVKRVCEEAGIDGVQFMSQQAYNKMLRSVLPFLTE